MPLTKTGADVYYASGPLVQIRGADLAQLKRDAEVSARGRCRICTHATPDHPIHEMIIVLKRGTYIRAHQHLGRSESVHVIEGRADVVVFDPDGAIRTVLDLGPVTEGGEFFYRMSEPLLHTVLVRSDFLVFHETTSGPFRRDDTAFAPWAPVEADAAAVGRHLADLEVSVARWRAAHPARGLPGGVALSEGDRPHA
ncbi:MAG: WbuC family cupin fold metalloprotein [Lentisphaerae bacterium]|nr:WbuC family cupin fold metalloprotein [Lentisphaerota bacterium]